MQRVPWRIAEEISQYCWWSKQYFLRTDPSQTLPFIPHFCDDPGNSVWPWVPTKVTAWISADFPWAKTCPTLSTSLPFSLWNMWSTFIRKNQPAVVPQLPVPAFCEGPPWSLVRCNLSGFWVPPWCGCDGSSVEGSKRVTSKSALHVDINTDARFYLCACIGYGYILSVQMSLSLYFHSLVVTGDRGTNYFLLLWW